MDILRITTDRTVYVKDIRWKATAAFDRTGYTSDSAFHRMVIE